MKKNFDTAHVSWKKKKKFWIKNTEKRVPNDLQIRHTIRDKTHHLILSNFKATLI